MKEIKLTHGYITTVDDEDFYLLSIFKWHLDIRKGKIYGVCSSLSQSVADKINNGTKHLRMHRYLMGVIDPSILVDHADLNPLNNQKHNLRKCTVTENNRNKSISKNRQTKYKGVSRYKGTWGANICVNKKSIWLGSFTNDYDAAIAYNEAAVKYFGEFANLNIIPSAPKQPNK